MFFKTLPISAYVVRKSCSSLFSTTWSQSYGLRSDFNILSRRQNNLNMNRGQQSTSVFEDRLIVSVCNYPILYDTSLRDYKNTFKTELVWEKVSEEVGASGKFWIWNDCLLWSIDYIFASKAMVCEKFGICTCTWLEHYFYNGYKQEVVVISSSNFNSIQRSFMAWENSVYIAKASVTIQYNRIEKKNS